MKLLIALHHRFELWTAPAWVRERLQKQFPELEVVQLPDYSGMTEHIRDADAALAWSLRPEQFRAARKLRWIHSTAAAVHQLIFPELVASEVVLTNSREVHGPVVAEHALALMFAVARKIPAAVRYQQQHVWGQERMWLEGPMPGELQGATLGLIGLGSIGSEIARRAAALGMRVLAAREHPERGGAEGVALVFGPAQLGDLLATSDYVVLAAPVTSATQRLIDRTRLAQMRPTACLINVGRGVLVDETALADALRHKQIAAAALDVLEKEPMPPDSPLWDMDNVLITPHTGSVTPRLWERQYILISENVRRFLAGEPLLGVVEKHRGY
ncbi:MAG TPA: D-2-hydroxyacid dehydrogenase [Terriglobales bacterium]|nr:D-2-hydroxyacid dehydrogenase [Terriglobales bacterium]